MAPDADSNSSELDRQEPPEVRSTDALLAQAYSELRELASRMLSPDPARWMMQSGTLLHQAYLRLMKDGAGPWNNRSHFMAAAVTAMRRHIVDEVRRRRSGRRGGRRIHVPLHDHDSLHQGLGVVDLVSLNDALDRLEQQDARMAAVASFRCFGGLSFAEMAAALDVSESTVHRDWKQARAWLRRELGPDGDGDADVEEPCR